MRPYQEQAIESIKLALAKGTSKQVVVMATGAGKTVLMAHAYKNLGYKKLLLLAHQETLLTQAKDKFQQVVPEVPCYLEQGPNRVPQAAFRALDRAIVLASVQTLSRPHRLAQFNADDFDMIMVDETHHGITGTYVSIYKYFGFSGEVDSGKLLLGVTATPERADGRGLDEIFEAVSYTKGTRELMEEGHLVPITCHRIDTSVSLDEVSIFGQDLNEKELAKAVCGATRNQAILDGYSAHLVGKKTVVFCVTREHSRQVCELFLHRGVPARTIDGEMEQDERDEIKAWLKNTPNAVIVNCRLLTEGFDEPSIEGVIMARPTLSKTLYQQCVGRGLRLSPGKTSAVLVDVVDASTKHSLETSSCILSLSKKFKVQGDLLSAVKRVEALQKRAKALGRNCSEATTVEELEEIVSAPLSLPSFPEAKAPSEVAQFAKIVAGSLAALAVVDLVAGHGWALLLGLLWFSVAPKLFKVKAPRRRPAQQPKAAPSRKTLIEESDLGLIVGGHGLVLGAENKGKHFMLVVQINGDTVAEIPCLTTSAIIAQVERVDGMFGLTDEQSDVAKKFIEKLKEGK